MVEDGSGDPVLDFFGVCADSLWERSEKKSIKKKLRKKKIEER